MKKYLIILSVLVGTVAFGQKIKFKVAGYKDTTVFLVKYYGKGVYYADTAEMKKGIVEFDGKLQKPGVLGLFLPGQNPLDFIYNNEEISLETALPDMNKNMQVKKSEENKVFYGYVNFLGEQRVKTNELAKMREAFKKDDPQYKNISSEIDVINKSVVTYQENLVKTNPDKLVAKIVKMMMDIAIPDAPKDDKGKVLDSMFAYKYYKEHYFDNVDLKDDRLLNTPMFHSKFDDFFSKKMLIQHPDTIVKYAFWFIDKLDQKSELFKYCLTHIASTSEKSNIMGMDKVFVRLGQRYYCARNLEGKSPAYWMTEDKLKDLCEKVEVNKNLVQGVVPPNVILLDTTETKWIDYYSIKAEYTILYFWDPECGHCKTSTPKLQKLYAEKLKARNVEVFAVGKAIGDEFVKWKKFIKTNNLTFINVALTDKLFKQAQEDARSLVPVTPGEKGKPTTLQSLNYQETFDIFSTPRVFVLDKDKKIVAKQLSISQLEDFLDHLQNYKGPKIIEPDPEDKEGQH